MRDRELLEYYLNQEKQNIFRAADDYTMTTPKRGCEQRFYDALARKESLERMLEETSAAQAETMAQVCRKTAERAQAIINSAALSRTVT